MPKKNKKDCFKFPKSGELVIRLRDYFERERTNGGPLIPIERVIDRVAAALDIGKATITRITKEKFGETGTEDKKMSTPKKRKRKASITDIDSFDTDAIRNHIYGYYERNEFPTLIKLTKSLKEAELFTGGITSLWHVLHKVGFGWKKVNKRKIIMERGDIVLARITFLEAAKQIQIWENVVFLDETWLNANHTVGKMWTDNTAHSSTKVPEGKGERLIICHAGNAKGFIPNALLAFKSKKTGDYHEEMNADKFEEWFENNLLNNLTEPSIIIMDNAKYHSRQLNKPPTSQNNKGTLVEWLKKNNVDADMSMLKEKLVQLVKLHKSPTPTYKLDEMAKERGHRVLRLPPYHCQYNAIELIWAQIKGYVAKHNMSPPFTANKMLKLLEEASQHVTAENWKKVIEKTQKIITDDWNKYIRIDRIRDQQLIIAVGEDSDSDMDTNSDQESSSDSDK